MRILKPFLAGLATLMFAVSANATIITIDHNTLLPEAGTLYIDLDGDGTNDIGMAERYTGNDRSWLLLDGSTGSTQMTQGFLALGTFVDDSLTWLTSGFQEPIMSIGDNYLGIFDTSLGALYGFATISYDGINMVLASYTFEDSGRGITVTSANRPASIPEPSLLALFGLGLAGLGYSRRK